jgi:hypothetical protein
LAQASVGEGYSGKQPGQYCSGKGQEKVFPQLDTARPQDRVNVSQVVTSRQVHRPSGLQVKDEPQEPQLCKVTPSK